MVNLPVIDMVRTGQNIGRLRKQAELSVRDLQDVFGFATTQDIYKWQQGVYSSRRILVNAAIFSCPCCIFSLSLCNKVIYSTSNSLLSFTSVTFLWIAFMSGLLACAAKSSVVFST